MFRRGLREAGKRFWVKGILEFGFFVTAMRGAATRRKTAEGFLSSAEGGNAGRCSGFCVNARRAFNDLRRVGMTFEVRKLIPPEPPVARLIMAERRAGRKGARSAA